VTIYEMTKNLPAFKRYCRREVNGKSPSMAEILAKHRKRRRADFAKYCKRRGPLSVLGEYTTGYASYSQYGPIETLIMQRINGEFVSTSPNRDEEKEKAA
jgi:hypothetical protein